MSHIRHIVGLGNPGRKYAKTRHNIGWLVLDALAGKAKWKSSKNLPGDYVYINVDGEEVELVKPETFMNNSGKSILYIKKKYPKVTPANFMIVHDDKDLEFGKIKVATDSGAAGHNGVQSIIDALGTKEFMRVRIGVGNADLNKFPTDKFVLSKFSRVEKKELDDVINEAVEKIKENI